MLSRDGFEGYAFSHSAVSGTVAAGLAGGSEIFQFRWLKAAAGAPVGQRCRILAVYLSAAVDATGFTAGAAQFSLKVARSWTADGSGGTDVTPAGNDNKMRTSQKSSLLIPNGGKIRIANTGALTAGTKTLDAQAVGNVVSAAGAAGTLMVGPLAPLYADGVTTFATPLVLDDKEGFVVVASVPVVGTWKFGVTTFWAEIDA